MKAPTVKCTLVVAALCVVFSSSQTIAQSASGQSTRPAQAALPDSVSSRFGGASITPIPGAKPLDSMHIPPPGASAPSGAPAPRTDR